MKMLPPILVRVTAHPYIANRWTHALAQADGLRRGWALLGDVLPLGTWTTREAVRQAAFLLQARGVVEIAARTRKPGSTTKRSAA